MPSKAENPTWNFFDYAGTTPGGLSIKLDSKTLSTSEIWELLRSRYIRPGQKVEVSHSPELIPTGHSSFVVSGEVLASSMSQYEAQLLDFIQQYNPEHAATTDYFAYSELHYSQPGQQLSYSMKLWAYEKDPGSKEVPDRLESLDSQVLLRMSWQADPAVAKLLEKAVLEARTSFAQQRPLEFARLTQFQCLRLRYPEIPNTHKDLFSWPDPNQVNAEDHPQLLTAKSISEWMNQHFTAQMDGVIKAAMGRRTEQKGGPLDYEDAQRILESIRIQIDLRTKFLLSKTFKPTQTPAEYLKQIGEFFGLSVKPYRDTVVLASAMAGVQTSLFTAYNPIALIPDCKKGLEGLRETSLKWLHEQAQSVIDQYRLEMFNGEWYQPVTDILEKELRVIFPKGMPAIGSTVAEDQDDVLPAVAAECARMWSKGVVVAKGLTDKTLPLSNLAKISVDLSNEQLNVQQQIQAAEARLARSQAREALIRCIGVCSQLTTQSLKDFPRGKVSFSAMQSAGNHSLVLEEIALERFKELLTKKPEEVLDQTNKMHLNVFLDVFIRNLSFPDIHTLQKSVFAQDSDAGNAFILSQKVQKLLSVAGVAKESKPFTEEEYRQACHQFPGKLAFDVQAVEARAAEIARANYQKAVAQKAQYTQILADVEEVLVAHGVSRSDAARVVSNIDKNGKVSAAISDRLNALLLPKAETVADGSHSSELNKLSTAIFNSIEMN